MKKLLGPAIVALVALTTSAQASEPKPTPAPLITLELGTTQEHLTNGYGNWQSLYFFASDKFSPRRVAYGSVTTDRRFGSTDETYVAGFYIPPSPNTTLNVEFGYSPTHIVLPQSSLALSLDHRLASGWGYTLGAQHRGYTGTDVQIGSLLVDRYWGKYRAAYTITGAQLSSVAGTALSHGALLTRYYGTDQESSVTLSLDAGREVENVGSTVITSSVAGAALYGVHWFGLHWGVPWAVSIHRQGSLYTRSGVQIGVRARL